MVKSMPQSKAREDLWQTTHALQRRLDVWTAARDSLGRPELEIAARGLVVAALAQLEGHLDQQPAGDTWRQYLLCDQLRRCLSDPAKGEHRALARRAIQRFMAAERDSRFHDWLQDAPFEQWERALRSWAVLPIDSVQLVHDLESFETDAFPRGRRELADLLDALQWTDADGEVLRQLNAHYRNANLRVGISVDLVERFAPQETQRREAVAETILGTPVRGASHVSARSRLFLEPCADAWLIGVAAEGRMDSSTWSSRGPATVYNDTDGNFAVSQRVRIDHLGVRAEQSQASAHTNSRLSGLETSVDGVPLLGWLTRQIVLNQYEGLRGEAQREAEWKLTNKLQTSFGDELEKAHRNAQSVYDERIAGPLARFRLQPEVVELNTTKDHLTGRFRVVGEGQLGAHTPRPQADPASLASVQIHETLINNVLDSMQLSGRRFELRELLTELAKSWGFDKWAPPEELPEGVMVQFAEEEAISVDMDEERIRLRLDVKRLENSDGKGFDDFQILVDFEPVPESRRLTLSRTGIIRVAGQRLGFRDRLPLRGIFAKVFNKSRSLDLLGAALQDDARLDGSELRQSGIANGWLILELVASSPQPVHSAAGARASLR